MSILLLIICTTLLPIWVLTATTHVILFGGGVGLHYSPNSLGVFVGDTIRWQGDFLFHPLSSTSVPVGAASWHNETGTIFNYTVLIPGTYNYQCDNHFSFGMTGSFVAVVNSPLDAPNLLLPSNGSVGIPVNPIFVWSSVATATDYHLQISTASDFSTIIQEDSLLIDTTKQITGLSYKTSYFWRTRAKDISSSSDWSGSRSFTTAQQPVIHVILFGGIVGSNYSPKFLEVAVGDTIQWQGDFTLHPMSSTTIPSGALSWNAIAGTIFNYVVTAVGNYDYQCDVHGGFGMVGSFVAVDYSPLATPNLLQPTNSATGVPINPTFVWSKVPNGTKYHIQISTVSNFLSIVQEDTLVTDTSKQISGLSNSTSFFWRARVKNNLVIGPWSSPRSFTTITGIPAQTKLLFPDSMSINQQTTLMLRWHRVASADTFKLQVSLDSTFASANQDITIADIFCLITNLFNDSSYFWRVGAKNLAGYGPWSNTWKFKTSATSPTMTVSVGEQWNMISMPLLVDDPRKILLFPTAISDAFDYSSAYNPKDSLAHGKGYWMKFSAVQNVPLIGIPLTKDTIDVDIGWNMIGSIFTKIPVSSINSIPSGIITSTFFFYNGATYLESDSIAPGSAYWVKSGQSGKLILSSTGSNQTAARILIKQSDELPPPPPGVVNVNTITMPTQYSLSQNFPNPFNPATVISYQLPISRWVTLKVYNLLGEEIATLVDRITPAGIYTVSWDGSKVPSGLYIYRLQVGSFSDIKKMVLLK